MPTVAWLLSPSGTRAGVIGWYVVGGRVGEERVRDFFARHGRWAGLSVRDAAWGSSPPRDRLAAGLLPQ